jgi:putative transcriptional regulator
MGVVNSVPDLRASRGMTQHELALALGVSRQTINSVERGRFEPSLSLALAIAAYFSRPFEEVFMLEA